MPTRSSASFRFIDTPVNWSVLLNPCASTTTTDMSSSMFILSSLSLYVLFVICDALLFICLKEHHTPSYSLISTPLLMILFLLLCHLLYHSHFHPDNRPMVKDKFSRKGTVALRTLRRPTVGMLQEVYTQKSTGGMF